MFIHTMLNYFSGRYLPVSFKVLFLRKPAGMMVGILNLNDGTYRSGDSLTGIYKTNSP